MLQCSSTESDTCMSHKRRLDSKPSRRRKKGRTDDRALSVEGEQDVFQDLFAKPKFHEPQPEECPEDELYFADEASSSDSKLPVRLLKTYTFYNLETKQLVPITPSEVKIIGASGAARPHYSENGLYEVEDDLEEVEDDMEDGYASWQLVNIDKIRSIYLDDSFSEPEIWIETDHAWYILDAPADNYKHFLEICYLPFLMTCAIFKEKKNGFSREDVSRILNPEKESYILQYARRILGRSLTFEDFVMTESEVRDNLRSRPPKKQWTPLKGSKPSGMLPFATEVVGKIAKNLFRSIEVATRIHASKEGIDTSDTKLRRVHAVHDDNPTNVKWGQPLLNHPDHYNSVLLDGVKYNVGDTVAVEPGFDSDGTRSTNAGLESSRSSNNLANRAWFCKIIYFFEEKRGKKLRSLPEMLVHVRWFEHGARTALAETAAPQALFLLDSCDTISVNSILQKIELKELAPDESEYDCDDVTGQSTTSYYYRYKWKESEFSYVRPSSEEEDAFMDALGTESHQRCYSCALIYRDDLAVTCKKSPTSASLEIYGKEYHVGDFVYVKLPSEPILLVCQLMDLSCPDQKVKLRRFLRLHEIQGQIRHPSDTRSLLLSDKCITKEATCINGRCYVKNEDEISDLYTWISKEDHFFVASGESELLEQCRCCAESERVYADVEAKIRKLGRLSTMDIFSGAGGLTTGMDMSGLVETKWIIERSTSACMTIKTNHPDVTVYNQDCNVLLKNAVTNKGKTLRSVDGSEALPPLPSPGEVDMIVGGPPCQAFSGMNRYKTADDIRLTLIPTMLSYVEYYQPKYVLLENVTGLLYFQLRGKQQGARIVDGVKAGMVKFIMRTFVALGYQVQARVLNSADYGSPQQRNRVIFWASRLDVRLPKWPIPNHIPRNGHNPTTTRVATIGFIPKATRNALGGEEGHDCAPFFSPTIFEAVDDLPPFHWENPCIYTERFDEDSIPCFPADSHEVSAAQSVAGFDYPVLYHHSPRTLYQAWVRQGFSDLARVTGHYTGILSPIVIERTVNIAIKPRANYKTLPRDLRLAHENRKDVYNRLDGNGEFKTMMASTVNPAAKGSWLIHPSQRRILTVREYARAQGFPDWYEFQSVETLRSRTVEDEYRQIGNAVPVTLALALAKGLLQGLIEEEMDTHGARFIYRVY